MKPFSALTPAGRFRRLRTVAVQALAHHDLGPYTLKPLVCWENATWRVCTSRGDFLLRVHRHGYRTHAEIEAELAWLGHLARSGHSVARPVAARDGRMVVSADAKGVPGPRFCTLLTWMRGRIHRTPGSGQLRRIGRLFAGLHAAAASAPALGPRPRFDDTGWFAPVRPDDLGELGALLDDTDRLILQIAQGHTRDLFARLDRSKEAWGPIHADLHFANVVHTPERASPIDFDDMGTGPFLYDLAIPYMRCCRRPDARAAWGHLVAGYRERRALTDAQLDDVRALAVLQMPGVFRYMASRWPDPEVVALVDRIRTDTRDVVQRWEAGDLWPFVRRS